MSHTGRLKMTFEARNFPLWADDCEHVCHGIKPCGCISLHEEAQSVMCITFGRTYFGVERLLSANRAMSCDLSEGRVGLLCLSLNQDLGRTSEFMVLVIHLISSTMVPKCVGELQTSPGLIDPSITTNSSLHRLQGTRLMLFWGTSKVNHDKIPLNVI